MTRTESIGRILGTYVAIALIATLSGMVIGTSVGMVEDRRAMSAIYNDSANRKAHERTAKWFVSAHADASKRTGADPSASREIAVRSASAEVISLKTKQKDGELQSRVAKASNPSSSALAASPKGLTGTKVGTRRSPEREPVTANTEGQPRSDEASRSLSSPIYGSGVPKTPATGHVARRATSAIQLRPIQEDAWPTLVPVSYAGAPAAAMPPAPRFIAANATSVMDDTPIRRRPVEHPSNPTPRDLSGLPMYRLSRIMTDGVTTAMEETEDIITTITFRRNDPSNKIDLTHPVSVCVEYPDAADHARSCGSANWMAPDTNDLTIDVVMPRRNTSGEPYARFGQNITCNVTYYDEREGAHMVMTTEQWSGGDCGAVAMIVVGGQP